MRIAKYPERNPKGRAMPNDTRNTDTPSVKLLGLVRETQVAVERGQATSAQLDWLSSIDIVAMLRGESAAPCSGRHR